MTKRVHTRLHILLLSFLLLAASSFAGCLLDGQGGSAGEDGLIIIGPDDTWPTLDPYQVFDAAVEGDRLTLEVAYAGGCREHAFAFYSTGPVIKTNPPGADLWIRHDGNGDACEAYIHEEISVGLTPIRAPGGSEVRLHILEFDFEGNLVPDTTVTYTY